MATFLAVAAAATLLAACHGGAAQDGGDDETVQTVTPVTVTGVTIGPMQQTVELNATSTFLRKSYINATTNGYIKSVGAQLGHRVSEGQALFTLRAKEAENLGAELHKVDTTLHFTGVIRIAASSEGFITAIDHQAGDYVVEGDRLAEISDLGSLVFIMQMPYEYNRFLPKNETVALELPDGKVLKGNVSQAMPTVDPVSQTQNIVIKVTNDGSIPENLVAKVRLVTSSRARAVSVPRDAVLADETQENFWIMKAVGDTMAIRVPVTKGIENAGRIEIVSPALSTCDVLLETGNYGLPDSARITIEKP